MSFNHHDDPCSFIVKDLALVLRVLTCRGCRSSNSVFTDATPPILFLLSVLMFPLLRLVAPQHKRFSCILFNLRPSLTIDSAASKYSIEGKFETLVVSARMIRFVDPSSYTQRTFVRDICI
jgi:hypothetical protein